MTCNALHDLGAAKTTTVCEALHSVESRYGNKNVNRCGGYRGRCTVALVTFQQCTGSIQWAFKQTVTDCLSMRTTPAFLKVLEARDKRREKERTASSSAAGNKRKAVERDGALSRTSCSCGRATTCRKTRRRSMASVSCSVLLRCLCRQQGRVAAR